MEIRLRAVKEGKETTFLLFYSGTSG